MSGGLSRLVFDPTEPASSHNVGAYIRAGTDGDLIGSETLNTLEWLRVAGPIIDSTGQEVGVTGNALNVSVVSAPGAGSYPEDSAHASGDDGQFMLSLRVDDLAAVPVGLLASTEGDYQAVFTGPDGGLKTSSFTLDGAGQPIDSTGGYLHVNVLDFVADPSLANSAIATESRLVSTTAINITTSPVGTRKWLCLSNEGNKSLYWGTTGVTAANGFPTHVGMQQFLRIGGAVAMQVIGESGSSSEDLRVAQLS